MKAKTHTISMTEEELLIELDHPLAESDTADGESENAAEDDDNSSLVHQAPVEPLPSLSQMSQQGVDESDSIDTDTVGSPLAHMSVMTPDKFPSLGQLIPKAVLTPTVKHDLEILDEQSPPTSIRLSERAIDKGELHLDLEGVHEVDSFSSEQGMGFWVCHTDCVHD